MSFCSRPNHRVPKKVPIEATSKFPRAALEFAKRQMDYFLLYFGREMGQETVDTIPIGIRMGQRKD
jgi:hypothetical protein